MKTDAEVYRQFLVWFKQRWPQFDRPLDSAFDRPLDSAFECYCRGRSDLMMEQLDDEL